jgi:site-specific DNA-methyltransferase (adenine-specific)
MLKNSTSARFCQTACYAHPGIELYNADNSDVMPMLADESIDVICIDPPYLYLKGQKLERPFDEKLFFNECKRLLTKNGFIVLFGRGTSFYRWNTILEGLGFTFKEEIIWNKEQNTSPVTPINRVHETVVIYSKNNSPLKEALVPYVEMKSYDLSKIQNDISRIASAVESDFVRLKEIKKYLQTGEIEFKDYNRTLGVNLTVQTRMSQQDRTLKIVQAIKHGMKEKSIISVTREHYKKIHPTEKPVRLLERLLSLVSEKECTVADFFAGSMSTMEAVYNLGLKGIAVEIDKEYFEDGKKRIEKLPPRQTMLFE